MSNHRIEEILELLDLNWKKNGDLSLIQFIKLLAEEAGHEGDIMTLTDDELIFNLAMRNKSKDAPIPGLEKDTCEDFKTAILAARNFSK